MREGPLLRSCGMHREGRVSAASARTTKQGESENYSERFTGRPRPIPDVGSMRSYDKVCRRDVLERAWELVRANCGTAGIDRQTIADVERDGIDRPLDELAADLKDGRYRPLAACRVFIPKPGSPTEQRPLSIPTGHVKYRCVVQRAFGFVGGHASVPSAVWKRADRTTHRPQGARSSGKPTSNRTSRSRCSSMDAPVAWLRRVRTRRSRPRLTARPPLPPSAPYAPGLRK